MLNYFFSDAPGFGRMSWLMMLGWLLSLGAGAYLYSVWQERNPVRARFFRRFGLGLSILSAAGLLLLAMKALALPYLGWRIWSYTSAIATILFIGWAAWFYVSRLPQLLAATSRQGARPSRNARSYESNGSRPAETRPAPPPRPVATTGRREARRDRKRKSR